MLPIPKEGIFLKDGGNIMLHVKDRIIKYKPGDIVNLSPNELSEICFLVHLTTDDIVKSAYEYAKRIGIEEKDIKKGSNKTIH